MLFDETVGAAKIAPPSGGNEHLCTHDDASTVFIFYPMPHG
jgi:hypothetical protein